MTLFAAPLPVIVRLSEMAICDVQAMNGTAAVELGLPMDAKILAHGDHLNSVMWQRMNARLSLDVTKGKHQMPPFGTLVRDDVGVELIKEWIETFVTTCP